MCWISQWTPHNLYFVHQYIERTNILRTSSDIWNDQGTTNSQKICHDFYHQYRKSHRRYLCLHLPSPWLLHTDRYRLYLLRRTSCLYQGLQVGSAVHQGRRIYYHCQLLYVHRWRLSSAKNSKSYIRARESTPACLPGRRRKKKLIPNPMEGVGRRPIIHICILLRLFVYLSGKNLTFYWSLYVITRSCNLKKT